MKKPKICFDRVLPANRFRPLRFLDLRSRLIAPLGKQWINGTTLRVLFMGGTRPQHETVKREAAWWEEHANIHFNFNGAMDSEIRITFDGSDGAWSYIGTDCASIPLDQPTMNLGFLDEGTAAHEIGHCLAGDTLIDCPRDLAKFPRGIPIRDLVGTQPWVYAWKDGSLVIRKASHVWLSKKSVPTVRVVLRTGQGGRSNRKYLPPLEIVGTPEHPVLFSDGLTWRKLGELQPGDSLCSMYRQGNGQRSRIYWTRHDRVPEHVFVSEQVYGPRPGKSHAHHKNLNKLDQSPDNLEWKDVFLHLSDHGKGRKYPGRPGSFIGRTHTPEARAKMSIANSGRPLTEEVRRKISESLKGKAHGDPVKRAASMRRFYDNGGRSGMFGKKASEETRRKHSESIRAWHAKMGHNCTPVTNHIVLSVECGEPQDVYDMTVPDAESFIANGVVVHNCLGCSHEHQNPRGGIQWNEEAVYRALADSPNYWDRETTFHNVLRKYRADQINGSEFDPSSIMLYWFPSSWTLNGVATTQNNHLSALDRAFIAKMYPKPKPIQPTPPTEPTTPIPLPNAKTLIPNHRSRTQASIRKPGEEDLFMFTVPNTGGSYLINTRGNTNVAMRLFGPNSNTLLIAEDDDSGLETNAQITAGLIHGAYYVQIRHADQSKGIGKYTVKCFHKKVATTIK